MTSLYIPGAWTISRLIKDPKDFFFPSPKHPDDSKIIWDEEILMKMYRKDPVDLWLNSFGGSRSNYVANLLEAKYKIRNDAYRSKGCHYIRPLDIGVDLGIFCYVDDLGVALTSQLNRNFQFNFQKLCDVESEFSIGNWIQKISEQVDNWSDCEFFPVFYINTDNILEHCKDFESMFGIEIQGFSSRKTYEWHELLIPHRGAIEEVNSKLRNLPDIGF